MILKQLDVDRLRELVANRQAIPAIVFDGCDLPTALELACTRAEWCGCEQTQAATGAIARWARTDDRLSAAVRALDGVRADVERWSAPVEEFAPLGTRESLDDQAAGFFDRFTRSLERHGRFAHLSRGIAKAMFDMADNAIQHSGVDEYHPSPGAMGYQVAEGSATFAVVDVGRGVLESLRTNPTWVQLATSRDALEAAIMRAASRRPDQGAGGGFSDLHKALADLSGKLRFASGDSVLKLEGERASRVVAWGGRPQFAGLQLSISIEIAL